MLHCGYYYFWIFVLFWPRWGWRTLLLAFQDISSSYNLLLQMSTHWFTINPDSLYMISFKARNFLEVKTPIMAVSYSTILFVTWNAIRTECSWTLITTPMQPFWSSWQHPQGPPRTFIVLISWHRSRSSATFMACLCEFYDLDYKIRTDLSIDSHPRLKLDVILPKLNRNLGKPTYNLQSTEYIFQRMWG